MSDIYVRASKETPTTPETESDEQRFIQRALHLMLQYNTCSEDLRERLYEIGRALRLPVQVHVGYRNVTVYMPDGVHVHAEVAEFRINIAVSAEVNRVIDKVCAGQLSLPAATAILASVEKTAGRHDRWTLALMFGLAAGALAWLQAADWGGMAVVALSAAAGMLARQFMHRFHPVLFALPFVAALIGSLMGGVAILLGWTHTPGICLIVPALMLVPGPHLINGLYDMLANSMQTGVPRFGLAIGILVAAAMGIFLGGWVTLGMTTVPPWQGAAQPIPLWLDVVLAGVASCGFGAFFNAPWRVLWTSIACGMVGHGIRYLCLNHGMSLEIAALFACAAIGFMAIRWVASRRIPFAAVAFAGAVPMMPGVAMFRSIGGAMDIAAAGGAAPASLVAETLANFFNASFIVGAMGMGLLTGAWLGKQLFRLMGWEHV